MIYFSLKRLDGNYYEIHVRLDLAEEVPSLLDLIQGSFFSFLYKQSSAINLLGVFCQSVVNSRNEGFDTCTIQCTPCLSPLSVSGLFVLVLLVSFITH